MPDTTWTLIIIAFNLLGFYAGWKAHQLWLLAHGHEFNLSRGGE